MLIPPTSGPRRRGQDGLTLLELMIVVAVTGVVLAIASSALISLTTTANRDSTMVTDEQKASVVLSQLSRDIRSAHSITFSTWSFPQPANEVQLNLNKPGGGTTAVQWVYCASQGTLTRYMQATPATCPASSPLLSGVANPASTPVFTYFDRTGTPAVTSGYPQTPPGSIAACTTRISVQLYVAPPPGTTGVGIFHESADVALTDQLAVVTQPGNGQC